MKKKKKITEMKVKLHLLRKRYKELISVDVTLDRNRCSFSFKIQSLHFVPSEKNNNNKKKQIHMGMFISCSIW